MRAVDADPLLRPAAEAKGVLGCYLRNRLRADIEAGRPCDMEGVAIQAVNFGTPELAEAAAAFLDQHYGGKAGNSPAAEAEVGPITWADAEAPGVGNLRWRNWDWAMLDYRDRLTLPNDLQSILKKGQAAV